MTKKSLVGGVLDWLVVEEKNDETQDRLIAHIGEIKVETLQNSPFFRAGQAGLLFVPFKRSKRKERKRNKGNTNRAFTS